VTRLLALSALLVSATPALAQQSRPKADLQPLVAGSVHPGGQARLALRVSLPEGLHTQSNKPRQAYLIPTVLTMQPTTGVAVDEIVWPATTDLQQAGNDTPLAVFDGTFLIGVQITIDPAVRPGTLALPATIRYQACNASLCFAPQTASVEWTLTVAPKATPLSRDTSTAAAFASIKFGTGEKPSGAAVDATPLRRPVAPAPAEADAPLQMLDRFAIAGTTGGYQGSADFLAFIHNAEAGVQEKNWFEGRGPVGIILLVLVGGLALNLTPCVLPMIPINLAIIGAGAQARSRGRGFLLGSAYGGAMAIVYGILGLIVILTAGTFGTLNSSGWFNLVIAVVFVILGLAMFEILVIDFSKYSARYGGSGHRGSMLLAFSMGAVAALLAGACVAPVVIQVVLFSSNLYATGTRLALALPFCLGIGMAIPWPIAGAGLAALPKPGVWMVRVKQAFGVFILATAAYYAYEAYAIFSNRWVDPKSVESSVQEQVKAGWHASLAEGLATAEREHRPVLVDMWATWCKNCLTMDKTTLASPDVKQALDGYVKIKFEAEDPDTEPAKSVLQRLSARGLPAYAILKPRS